MNYDLERQARTQARRFLYKETTVMRVSKTHGVVKSFHSAIKPAGRLLQMEASLSPESGSALLSSCDNASREASEDV